MKQAVDDDISPDFKWDRKDAALGAKLIRYEKTPHAIRQFARQCDRLTNHGYWFFLGSLWVSYTGFSDLELWKRLFSSPRGMRETSLMKPSELRLFRVLPDKVHALRAHRPGETDWIAYTLNADTAARFAVERGVDSVSAYEIDKADILCLFTRRGEAEIIVLDKSKARFLDEVTVIRAYEQEEGK